MFHKTKLTQAQRILKAVKNRKGATNWELSKISLNYTATQTFRYYEVV